MKIYNHAFLRHDPIGFTDYMESVKKGETKINAGTITPNQIAHEVLRGQYTETHEQLWDNMPDYVQGNKTKALAVVDVSGSMEGTPMEVAIGLGLYLSERTLSAYRDYFITFSSSPRLQKIIGSNLREKISNMVRADWGMNTNIEKAFDLILNVAIDNHLKQDEIVDRLIIISDMEFDYCDSGADKTLFQHIKEKFNRHNYEMPKLVFWNVDARNKQVPMTVNDAGVQLVSGFSPQLFEYVLRNQFLSPQDLINEVVESERYKEIKV